MKKNFLKTVFISLSCFVFAFPVMASSPFAPGDGEDVGGFERFFSTVDPTQGTDTSIANTGDLTATIPQAIGAIINLLLGFVGIIMLFITVWAGYIWLTAGGNETRVTEAKKMISRAAIGLVLAFSAFAISSYVVDVFERAVFEKTDTAPAQTSATP